MRRVLVAVLALLTAAGLLAASPAGAVGGTTNTTVVHGIPGLTVDVYVDGSLALDDFAPGTVAGPLTLPAGSHAVAITAADAADDSSPVLAADVVLVAGADMSIVAHLTAAGDPTVSVFTNDTSDLAAGDGRITVRHLAAAPAVDVLAGGSVAFAGLQNGDSAAADLPAGTLPVSLNAAGTSTQAFPASGTVDVALPAGVNLVVYAIGDLGAMTFDLVTQTIGEGTIGAPSQISVVHGVPGLTVDVYVGGVLLLEDFAPATVAGPVLLPAGTYDIEVFAADAAYEAGMGAIFVDDAVVPGGANISVVAHLDAAGAPTASIFVNDTSAIADGEARLVVRHTAKAPTVDVVTGSTKLADSISNDPTAESQQVDVPAGTYPVTVNAEDDPNPAVDLGDVTLPEGQATIVYAIGELGTSFGVAVQSIVGLGADGAFDDSGATAFYSDDVRTLLQLGITNGTSATTYSPDVCIPREQMAAFLVRTLNLPASDVDAFDDDEDSPFEDEINALAASGITTGTSATTYSPEDCVTREQMALFLMRAFSVPAAAVDAFPDDDGRTGESAIDALFAAGITKGTSATTYSPDDVVTRGQMASFVARALALG
jgi:hypothetical protein